MTKPRIYLDHAATTPIRPEAKAAMMEAMERWANPSSPHAEGRAARAALEDARERIKRALGWDGELIFTSGASEAIEIAMRRTKLSRRLISPVEHEALFRAAPDAELLPLDSYGKVPDVLADSLRGEPALVAIQHINSETGIEVMPIEDRGAVIHDMVRAAGGVLLCDCSQSRLFGPDEDGTMQLPPADMYVLSGHKLGGPPGIGALLVRDLSVLNAAGGQEKGYRGGTENLPAAIGFAAAVEAAIGGPLNKDAAVAVDELRDLERAGGDQIPWHCAALTGARATVAKIKGIVMPHLSARAQLIRFDQMGFAVSAGSACSSGSMKPSRVLKAFGVPDDVAARTIRVSFGWTTTAEEIEAFKNAWLELAEDAKARA